MPIGIVLNKCALSYVDHLLQHTHVHRGKSIQYQFQRLIVVCGRSNPIVTQHAVRIILAAFGFSDVSASVKKFVDEATSMLLLARIVQYATETYEVRSTAEVEGAQRLFSGVCEQIVSFLGRVDDPHMPSVMKHFLKKIIGSFDALHSIAFFSKLSSSAQIKEFLLPLYERLIDFASIGRPCLQTVPLIDVIAFYLSEADAEQEIEEERKGKPSKTSSIIEYLNLVQTEENSEVIQALVFLLIAKKRRQPIDQTEGKMDSQVNNLISSRLCNPKVNATQSVKEALRDSLRDAIVVRLEYHGMQCMETIETFNDALLQSAVQKDLVTTSSVGSALMYMIVTTYEIATQIELRRSEGLPALDESKYRWWNGKVFVQTINQYNTFQPPENIETIVWSEVIKDLDFHEFVCDKHVFMLLSDVIDEAFPNNTFPVKFLYSPWKNVSGHLSWIQSIVEIGGVFNLGSFPHTSVIQQSHNLKQMPDDADPHVANWSCLELTGILLQYLTFDSIEVVKTTVCIFEIGITQCPDVVFLALLQAQAPWTTIRNELLQGLVPNFIMTSTNAVPILNYAWSDTHLPKHLRQIIVTAFTQLYVADDQQKLAKILDVAHELKPAGLSEVLSLPAKHLPFVIDLACLASKRDYLKLEKWLQDKHRSQGDTVLSAVLTHIQRRYKKPQLVAALTKRPPQTGGLSTDPVTLLLSFASTTATDKQKQHFSTIFQVMKENSGRSSSVSSAGGRNPVNIGPAVFGSGPPPPGPPPPQDQRPPPGPIQRGPPVPQFAPAPGAPPLQQPMSFSGPQPSHMMFQGQPGASAPSMNLLMGMGPFGNNSRDLLKSVQPTGPPPPSMSPSNQMLRSQLPPMSQRQNLSTVGWHGASSSTNRPPGPGTPAQHMDFRQMPPGSGPVPDFVPQRHGVIGGQVGAPPGNGAQQHLPEDIAMMNFAEDVQEEANSYFEKIYSQQGTMSVNDLINLLRQFKISGTAREQKVLACVVKNLFEEYRFFHEYPERELRTTAEVYGGIIREGIIGNVQFATAVRKVIESLQADITSMLWTFGIVALQNCRTKLCSYPKVCTMIATLENFSKFPPNLKDYVLAGVKGEQPADAGRATPPIWSAAARVDPKTALPTNRTGNSVLSYTNVDTLVAATEKDGAEVAQPVEAIVDKISFLFNNLSQANLLPKKDEVVGMMQEHGDSFTRWLSQYIVMKRVSIEQNFQPLYNQFVQAIDSPILDAYIKRETFRNIKILLRTDKRTNAASNYSDRQLLKNLGMWLGAITIARSKPIRLNELDLKSLLLEAYYKGQAELLFVVPFISKILMSCSKTNIFTSSCAWIKSILKVLAELHNEPDLKINLKFEIEVLCKELNVDLSTLSIDGVLKDTEKLVRVPQQLCEVKVLGRPDVPSPVPSQIRLADPAGAVGISPAPGEAKPSTPQPEGESGSTQAEQATTPTVTHFSYHDINVHTYEGLIPHVKIQTHLPLFQLHPHAKHLVRPAMTHAIKELIGPVTERALKIAMTVTESMIRKDFAMDPDEKNMKLSAFHMMRAMTAGMAMITCRDPLASTMIGYLTQAFQNALRSASQNPELQKMIDEASQTITQENVELSTNFIVKTACEKASLEIEKRLETEYQRRANARRDGEAFRDEAAMAIQKKLPAQIAIPPGVLEKSNLAVYEQFSSRICGFKPTNEEVPSSDTTLTSAIGGGTSLPPMKELDGVLAQMQHFIKEVDQTTQAQPHVNHTAFQAVCMVRELLSNVVTSRDPAALLNLINRSVEHLLHAYHLETGTKNLLDVEWTRRLRDLFVGVMRLMLSQFTSTDLSRRVTAAVINIRSDYKWNMEGIEILLKQNLIQTALWDQHLAASMDGGGNLEATMFAQKFVRSLGGGDIQKLSVIKEAFPQTCEQLLKLQQMQSATRAAVDPPSGPATGGAATPVAAAGAGLDSPIGAALSTASETMSHATQRTDDSDMTGKVELILRDWINLCYTPMGQRNPQEALSQMIQLMHEHGVLATDDKITQFFRLCVEMCVDVSVRMIKSEAVANAMPHQTTIVRQRCYYTLDAFVKLMALMIRHSDNGQSQNKINLLKKLLNIVVGVLHMDHEVRRADFNAMPYHRILISLFNEITGPDPQHLLEPIAWSILEAFGQTLFALQPRRVPGFAFAWLDIVGHRHTIGRLLANTGIAETVDPVKTAATFTQLIICHLKFLAPFLRNIQLPKSIAILYKGTLRVLLVILHDFPELLCEYHYVICDTIPPNCVQLRNLVLSAYPRNMRLPDPFALNFKQVDNIPEMSVEPKSNLNMATIIPDVIRVPLDDYLANRSSVDFLSSLPSLLLNPPVPGSKYNTTVMNALVLYVGIRAIESLHARRQRISIHTIAHTSYMDIFQNLAVQLCTEGRYLLFNGIANQLRYPNAHTHYFSCVFLFLFLNSDCDAIQEQITRILFERLVALRPHPWGLLITFIELIKNPTYNFWKYEFTRCAPEIERLFQNVANTCVPSQHVAVSTTATQSSSSESRN